MAATGLEGSEPANVLASLVDHSLIERTSEGYRLLETTREFALDATQLPKETTSNSSASRTPAGSSTSPSAAGSVCAATTRTAGSPDWTQIGQTCAPPYRSSADRGDVEAVTAILTALVVEAFWRRPEVFQWADEAYQRFAHVDQPRRHELIGAAGWASWALGDVQECLRRAHEAVDLRGRRRCHRRTAGVGRGGRDGLVRSRRRGQRPHRLGTQRARQDRDRWLESIMLSNRALGSLMLGRWDDCEATARAADRACR